MGAAALLLLLAGCSTRSAPDDPLEIGKCCQQPGDCPAEHCTSMPMLGLQVCSAPCSENEGCPLLSGCQRVGDGQGGFIKLCLPCELVANSNPRYCPKESGVFACW